ncbi:MAG: glycine cleavage system aminomethyltransferase GcvT [Alphaproteobacteria bacterium]|nr:glycine cleavage system aminomethyltransferase GcvT [Alphaproteobacteria bacterium]
MIELDHAPLMTTALHQSHLALGAKMGAFAGYDMPLYYDLGVLKEHEWVRSHCGIFDVSHMGQVRLKENINGPKIKDFLQKITPSSFEKLGIGRAKYSVLVNRQGGIVDDLMVTRLSEDEWHLVINAGCKQKDIEWIRAQLPGEIEFTELRHLALIAVQGPMAERVMGEVLGIDLTELKYMGVTCRNVARAGAQDVAVMISRLGYTGEDGFEISLPNDSAPAMWQKLLGHSEVRPIGLAARDSLRLEMGYCLYGHDIDETTTPREAGLEWVMDKEKIAEFPAPERKRVGVQLLEKGVAREGADVINCNTGAKIGVLTSGGFSPTLNQSIGQAYLPTDFVTANHPIAVMVRGRAIAAQITPMPFVPPKTKSAKSG